MNFIAGIILARILEPADFGVFIAVSIYTHLLLILIRFGIPPALLQAEEIDEQQTSTCFWIMQALAVGSSLVVVLVAGVLEQVYGDPRYSGVMYLSCVSFFIIPYSVICRTLLQREINFRPIAITRIVSNLVASPLSICLALWGLGPYSLVLSGVVSTVLSAIFFAFITRWTPCLCFSPGNCRHLLRYAWNTNLANLLSDFSERVDSMMVGAMMNTSILGIYNRAYSLSRLPVEQLALNLRTLLFSSLSRLQGDLEETSKLYKRALCSMALAVFPFLLLIMLLAQDFIHVVYGNKWLDTVEPLQIMVLGAFATMVTINLRALSSAQNLIGREVPLQMIRVVLTGGLVALAAPRGLSAVAVSIVVQEVLFLLLMKKMIVNAGIGITWGQMLYAVAPAVITTLVALCAAIIAEQLLTYNGVVLVDWSRLFVLTGVVLVTYAIAILGLNKAWPRHEALGVSIEQLRIMLRPGNRAD